MSEINRINFIRLLQSKLADLELSLLALKKEILTELVKLQQKEKE